MKEIKLVGLDQSLLYEKLDNGLAVYFIPYPNKTNYAMHYVTKFGSEKSTFKPISKKKMITIPDGTAHFLEHKMFEQETGEDPFTFAAKTGTSVNATTSFKTTQYYFEGNSGFDENLNYLLNYVHSPYFTDENVEKEKGIIGEEIKEYDDEVDWYLDEELRKALLQKDPSRNDIAGTVDSISKITKEILYDTYETYYQPSNMILLISGSFDPDHALELIKNNECLNQAKTNILIEEKHDKEPISVMEHSKELEFNIVNTKVSYGIKIPLEKEKNRYLFDLYLGLFSSIKFGISSRFKERMKQLNLMTSFYTERVMFGNYMMMVFVADTEKPEELIAEIRKELTDFNVLEEEIERLKKVWISSEVMMIDNISLTLDNVLYDIIHYGDVIPNKTEIFRSLNIDDFKEMLQKIDFNNAAQVTVFPKNK